MRALITYSTRYGSTGEVAQRMGKILTEQGIDNDVINLKKNKNKIDVTAYDGYIVGAGIRIGRWTKESHKFLKRNKKKFDQRKLGIFVSCGDAGDPEGRKEARKKYIEEPVLNKLQLNRNKVLYDAFGGVMDLTDESSMGFFFKKMMKLAAAEDENLDPEGKNDLRNWEHIKNFTLDFANRIK